MEQFYLEEPSLKRKNEVINYIQEHFKYNSDINGSGGLDSSYENYEDWLKELEKIKNPETCPKNYCPGIEYFLIRQNDNKLVGMINLRWNLNESLLKHGGHIGYGIRPLERRKGYNKINLYLCLIKARGLGLDKVLLTAYDDNIGSVKTIISLGGKLENKIIEESRTLGRYWIDVDKSLHDYKETYKPYIYIKK